MQPAKNHLNVEHLKQIWDSYVSTNVLPPDVDIDPLVALSWRRCALRMNPKTGYRWVYESASVLSAIQNRHIKLKNIARPIMEDIYQYLEGCCLALALFDNTGCMIESLGEQSVLDRLEAKGLRPGVFMDEGRAGTNAIALALTEGLPAHVFGPEHFLNDLHDLSTIATPIHELEGHPVGVIGLIEPVEHGSEQSFGIVVAAARAIENQLQAELIVEEANTRSAELYATMDSVTEGILSWNEKGTILHLNEQGGQIFHLAPSSVVGRPLTEHITLPEGLARAAARKEELHDVEIAFQVNGKPQECLVSLRMVEGHEKTPGVFIATLRRIEQVHQLVSRLVGAQARLTLDDIVGHGDAARTIRKQALKAAQAKACVLLTGETGTGKNVLARAIHNTGNRAGGPFLAINCRAIPHELALGEILGYESGPHFNGPPSGQPSKFELAHGGTLLLDEVDSLPLDTQAALQRVIEFNDVIRLGGTRVIPVDVRVIASTTKSMDALSSGNNFRLDLLLRLSSFVINTVPLRKRPEDIPLLVERLLDRLALTMDQPSRLTPASMELLCAYPWPGNIRELESVVERAVIQTEDQTIDVEHLPRELRQRRLVTKSDEGTELVYCLSETERMSIISAGRAARGNLTETARLLDIGRTTLWRKMKQFGISSDDLQN